MIFWFGDLPFVCIFIATLISSSMVLPRKVSINLYLSLLEICLFFGKFLQLMKFSLFGSFCNSIHFAMFCHILQHYCNFCSDISNFCNVIATFAVIFITFCNFLTLQFLAKFFKFANFKKLHCIFNAKFYHAIYCMI